MINDLQTKKNHKAMSQNETDFLRKLQNTIWTVFGLIMVAVIMATVPFYFNTQNDVKNTKEKIEELKTSKADRTDYELTVRQIQRELSEINRKLDKKADK